MTLLCCPFCGGKAKLAGCGYDGSGDCYDVYVCCSECDAQSENFVVDRYEEGSEEYAIEEATKAWNRQSDRDTKEALTKIIEECAEVQKEVCKVLLYGPDSTGFYAKGQTNIGKLISEIGDLYAAVKVLCDQTDIGVTEELIDAAFKSKLEKYRSDARKLIDKK